MACPRCGDLCTCLPSEDDSAEARISVLIDPEPQSSDITEQSFAASLEQGGWRSASFSGAELGSPAPTNVETDPPDWRDEVASRLQAHRARRRRRFDPDGSLNLQFEPADAAPTSSPRTQTALAVEPVHDEYVPPVIRRRPPAPKVEENNVIEFPPPAAPEATLLEELAEPIVPTPRILDVPEAVPEDAPPPLLAGLYLDNEDPQAEEHYSEISTGIDLPIQAAPMGPRFLCTLLDSLIVALASGGFLAIVLSTSNYQPQGKSALAGLLLLVGFFWSVYHLLFLTFSAGTPGMELAQLQLSDFEGNRPERPLRILRALGMMVSCMSLGMGFAWAMVDEDRLGWHDRITRTYLRQ
jgi:uncharacterized RDD family membrane protein YckC